MKDISSLEGLSGGTQKGVLLSMSHLTDLEAGWAHKADWKNTHPRICSLQQATSQRATLPNFYREVKVLGVALAPAAIILIYSEDAGDDTSGDEGEIARSAELSRSSVL